VAPPVSDIDFGPITPEPRFKAPDKTDRDLPFMNALRVVRDIVSDRDKRWIDAQLNPPYPQELDKRISDWRARYGKTAVAKARQAEAD
jgi:hypothetical protein